MYVPLCKRGLGGFLFLPRDLVKIPLSFGHLPFIKGEIYVKSSLINIHKFPALDKAKIICYTA
ncbi:MAG: hypothetical protein A3J63_04705 [Candidatus Moranbacteria bacterium RIFCSPHIGHO2_02_FULL_40_12b]|nr:MAG: hypothetical protein A3J63_04705 [Candidatus Moranbacteria bacterium RIFCSPHIGHO2_02_FULL_40_12b]OGI23413.1 MAG: hypothetical protein A3E91_03600 [Candidatus Moranbacteria bacterium RIFCSPHIGHO2_12_FULL_40_10]